MLDFLNLCPLSSTTPATKCEHVVFLGSLEFFLAAPTTSFALISYLILYNMVAPQIIRSVLQGAMLKTYRTIYKIKLIITFE